MKIYLIGMPGAGKSTIGVKLAEKLQTQFIDLDKEIENRERKRVTDIFRENGEDYFRLKEAEILREFAGSPLSFVLATGGGAPCFYNGIDTINETGISVFLDVDIKELAKRVSKNTNRPLLETDDVELKLSQLREKRLPVYLKAAVIIKNPTIAAVLARF